MNRLLAIAIDPPTGTGKTLSQTFPTLSSLISVIVKNSFTIAGTILLILLIFGGLMVIIGAGSSDSKKSAQGKALVTDAIIGFVIVITAYFIVQIVEVTTGLKILNSGL
ncbi:hypothetical protein HYV64_03955 [Candidatus Shapirobacteria bacterium]|nr:hypothetical protein [Candidatus Shapirobacteria bacterium]